MTFSADWLALREPVDHAARDSDLLARAIACAGPDALVVDLGSGTGSTARACDGHAVEGWRWRFVDGDSNLLDIAIACRPTAERCVMDLKDIAALPLADAGLVTASALLDLMPRDWVAALASRLSAEAIPFYAALNYDGVMRWSPAHPDDATITTDFNAHQRTDKGIGPALGPDSGQETASIFAAHDFDVWIGDSPWELGAAQAELHQELLAGIADAAAEMENKRATDWFRMRSGDLSKVTGHIGHKDILAIPRKSRAGGE